MASGETGERGPQGDHGQTGDQGLAGQAGRTGLTGEQGIPGPAVDVATLTAAIRMNRLAMRDRRLLVIFVFAVVAVIVLAYQIDVQRRGIIAGCLAETEIITKLNDQNRAFAQIEKDNPVATEQGQEIQRRRITAYEAALITLPAEGCSDDK